MPLIQRKPHTYLCLLCLSVSLLLSACSATTPSETRVQQKITNQLIKDTMGKLFEVESVEIISGTLNKDQEYIVNAEYALKYTHTLQDYIDYMFDNIELDNRIDSSALKKKVSAKLAQQYGHAKVGEIHRFQDKYTFRKEAFGWEIQISRDYSEIEPFLP